MTTEKFDITTFEKNKVNGECNYILEDGTKIKQFSTNEYYIEIITPPKPALFERYKKFYKTGELYLFFIIFPNDFIKLRKEYDKTGKLIEEIDYDKPFKFTFEQLLDLIKKEKDTIDLFDKHTIISRGVIEQDTVWEIVYRKTYGRRERIIVDGITGEILKRNYYLHLDN
ncbi:MAG: hypothetical protein CSA40_01955 [Flavobacteriales bacterium]|nr:MAG: hypothetical protein CSA40_01955 [Flavobacteriales bacterium]